jgi:hypothetical protein
MHNEDLALMGSTGSSIREVSNYASHGGTQVAAGLATVLESDGTVSTDTSEGSLIGVSLGKDLSDLGRTVVCHKGLKVPLQLKTSFNPTIGAQVCIEDDTGLGMAYSNGSGHRYVNAVYATGRLGGSGATGGIVEGATTATGSVGVALIDFPGGL